MCRSLGTCSDSRRQTWPFSQAALEREVLCGYCLLRFTSCPCRPFSLRHGGHSSRQWQLLASCVLIERLPQLLPKVSPSWALSFHMQQGKTLTMVLIPADCFFTAWFSNSLSFLCYHFSFSFESGMCPPSRSRPCPPLLCGAP